MFRGSCCRFADTGMQMGGVACSDTATSFRNEPVAVQKLSRDASSRGDFYFPS